MKNKLYIAWYVKHNYNVCLLLQKLILNMNRDQNIDHEGCPHPESHIEARLWHAAPWAQAQESRRTLSVFPFLKYLQLFDLKYI